MVKFYSSVAGKHVVGVGLEPKNIEGLEQGYAIALPLAPLGAGVRVEEVELLIVLGETEEDVQKLIMAHANSLHAALAWRDGGGDAEAAGAERGGEASVKGETGKLGRAHPPLEPFRVALARQRVTTFALSHDEKVVLLTLPKPMEWLSFGPHEAEELANALLKHAKELRAEFAARRPE